MEALRSQMLMLRMDRSFDDFQVRMQWHLALVALMEVMLVDLAGDNDGGTIAQQGDLKASVPLSSLTNLTGG